MREYETRDGRQGEIEYSGFGGGVTSVCDRPVLGLQRKAGGVLAGLTSPALDGIAASYGVPFDIKGGTFGMFEVGAFDATLESGAEVKFQLHHDEDFVVASTADRLEFHSDEKALGFRLHLVDDGIAEIVVDRKSDAVSVAFSYDDAKDTRMFNIDGAQVKLIKKAKLTEISLVRRGRISRTFAHLVDTAKCGSLASEMKSTGFGIDGAYCHLMRALEDVAEG